MQILETNLLKGPNAWSLLHDRLIVMHVALDPEEAAYAIKGSRLQHGLKKTGVDVTNGWAAALAQLAIQLQQAAGASCAFNSAIHLREGSDAYIVFEYRLKPLGLMAGETAIKMAEALLGNKPFDYDEVLLAMQRVWATGRLDESTSFLVREAQKRGIPWIRLNDAYLIQLGYGARQRRIAKTATDTSNIVGHRIAGQKDHTKDLLASMDVPVPPGRLIFEITQLAEAVRHVGFPLVVKPSGGNKGNGIIVGVMDYDDAVYAFRTAKKATRTGAIIVERYVAGSDFRLLVVDYKFVAAAKRVPPMVTGDGHSPVKALIQKINSDPRRGPGYAHPLTEIIIDDNLRYALSKNNLSLDSVLDAGQSFFLRSIANTSAGGTSMDATDQVHPENAFLAERVARIMGLNVCGIDIISPDIGVPYHMNDASVIEVNSTPGFRLHMDPAEGQPRNAAAAVIDMLFPEGSQFRIPIAAVSGTGDNRLCCDLIATLWRACGYRTGRATSDGVFIDDFVIRRGPGNDQSSVKLLLKDPSPEAVVIDCPPSAILTGGLVFQHCDIAVVPYLGEDAPPELARAVAVLPAITTVAGHVVLNADDPRTRTLATSATIVYTSAGAPDVWLQKHLENGAAAVYMEGDYIILGKNGLSHRLASIAPHTTSETIFNLLSFVAAGSTMPASEDLLKSVLQTAIPRMP
jgi:cyanophycin synthetase